MEARAFRHHLHQHPELSGKEYKSQAFISEQLQALGYQKPKVIGETSLLLKTSFSAKGPKILVRADFDALPIEEENTFAHRSQNPGVSHKCGHDGHASILFALAKKLREKPFADGTLYLLWQASEENGEGAQKVLDDPDFKQFPYDEAFALHNIPGHPLAKVLVKSSNFTAGVRSVSFHFKGLESHAAHPHEGRNPAAVLSKTLALADQFTHNKPNDPNYCILTPVYSNLGAKNYGISPASAEAHFTIRTWSGELLDQVCEELKQMVARWSEEAGLEMTYNSFEEFWPNINTASSVELIKKSAETLKLDYQEIEYPFSWGEDFGLFTKEVPGAMFGIGSGEDCPVLHHPAYDFPDHLIEPASDLFYQMLKNRFDGKH